METFLISLLASVLSSIIFIAILWLNSFSKWRKRINFLIALLRIKEEMKEKMDIDDFYQKILLNDLDNINDIYKYSIALKKIVNGNNNSDNIDELFDSLIKKHWLIKRVYIKIKRRKNQI